MTTITLDIIDDKAMNLLKDLEALNVIKLHGDVALKTEQESITLIQSLKGKMMKQPIEEIERQLADFRAE